MMEQNPAPTVEILSVDWQQAEVAFTLPEPSSVEAESRLPERRLLCRLQEENDVGRMRLDGLDADTAYDIELRWTGGTEKLHFRTLPAPEGDLHYAFAAVADPHISERLETRKGRLFPESASILRDIVDEANALRLDGFLIAGDVTDSGSKNEYATASTILAQLQCPLFAAPGDHDLPGGNDGLWPRYFGARGWVGDLGEFSVAVLDTTSGTLDDKGRSLLRQALESDTKPVLAIAHHQLVPDTFIQFGKHKCVDDRKANTDLVARLSERGGLWYAGHQNVPSRVRKGRWLQLNLPQTCHYLCGYILVRRYTNGFYHTFRPIRSEILNAWSRSQCRRAAERYSEPQWQPEYRRGRSWGESNFVARLDSQR